MRRRREHIVREFDLTRMNRPLADGAHRRGPRRLTTIALRVLEVTEWTVDRIDTVGAASGDHAATRVMPNVARISIRRIGRDTEPHTLTRRKITEAEDQRFQARAARCNRLDIC